MEKFAIIGISCLFPSANNPEEFWENLLFGKDSRRPATKKQFGHDPSFYLDSKNNFTEPLFGIHGGYIGDLHPKNNLVQRDDCYNWALYAAKEALKNSKYLENKEILANCGLVLGNVSFPTKSSQQFFNDVYYKAIESQIKSPLYLSSSSVLDVHFKPASMKNFISGAVPVNFISDTLGLKGVCFALDAACASSLYVIDLACKYLSDHKSDLMLAGGLHASDPFFINVGFSVFQAYSKNNNSWPLDQYTTGLIPGEGAGFIVLKRYADAIRDNDNILAVIVGSGLSNDGYGGHALLPHTKGQTLAFARAYKEIDLKSIMYIEMHATGTVKGDAIELKAIEDFFGEHAEQLLVGAVKANTGHLLSAAGMVSIIKSILSLQHKVIPATIGVTTPISSPKKTIGKENIVCQPYKIKMSGHTQTQRIGINAFGFGGSNAHIIIENHKSPYEDEILRREKSEYDEKLAIIGMASHFGACNGLSSLKHLIQEGLQCFRSLPKNRWKGMEKFFGQDFSPPKGAYLSELEIDPLYFKIPPKEISKYNSQYLLMLKVADQAIKDAGYQRTEKPKNIAVIIAMHTEPSIHLMRARCDIGWKIREFINDQRTQSQEFIKKLKDYCLGELEINQFLSYIGNIIATQISSLWNFSGPAFTLSAGENSVFKAVEIGQLLLKKTPDLEAVIVGGVDLAAGFESYLFRKELGPVNSSYQTMSFDNKAQGWILGEGGGAIVLCREKEAKQITNKTYAILDAVEINYAPNKLDQQTLIRTGQKALQKAQITSDQIGYLEASANGFKFDDDLELRILSALYGQTNNKLYCTLGSIKSNIGNTFVASGIASIIKTALCLYHNILPCVPNWNSSDHPELQDNGPFYILQNSRHWFLSTKQKKRIAGISGLERDGSYAHLILSETEKIEKAKKTETNISFFSKTESFLIPITGNDKTAILANLKKLTDDFKNRNTLQEAVVKWNHMFSEKPGAYVLSLLSTNKESLLKEIDFAYHGVESAFNDETMWQTPTGSYFTATPLKNSKIAFVYPPNGLSYVNQGETLFCLFPEVMEELQKQVPSFIGMLGEDVYPRSCYKLTADKKAEYQKKLSKNVTELIETGISFSLACTRILMDELRLVPHYAFGISMGEISMLVSHNIWQDIQVLSKRLHSSALFKNKLEGEKELLEELWTRTNVEWKSYILLASQEKVSTAIQNEKHLFLTFVNSPNEVVIAGAVDDCLRIIGKLKVKFIENSYQGMLHTTLARSVYAEISDMHNLPINPKTNIRFLSAANYEETELTSKVLANNIAEIYSKQIDFPRLVNLAYSKGVRIFIECGPTGACTRWIGDILKKQPHLATNPISAQIEDKNSLKKVFAKLLSHQIPFDTHKFLSINQKKDATGEKHIWTLPVGGETLSDILSGSFSLGKNNEKSIYNWHRI